jgi:hypothetical protein
MRAFPIYDDTAIQTEVDLNTTDRHTHTNKTIIDNFGESLGGLPTYNGNNVDTVIAQRDVYDGLDSLDNTISLSANNGKVLKDVQDTQQIDIDLNTANKVDKEDYKGLFSMAFMIHQAAQMQLNQIEFVKSINNNWI